METVSVTVPVSKLGVTILKSTMLELNAHINGVERGEGAAAYTAPTANKLQGASAAPAGTKKKKRGRRTKAEIEADKAAEVEAAQAPADDADEYLGMGDSDEGDDDLGIDALSGEESAKEIDLEKDIIPKFKLMVESDPKKGKEKAVKILQKYGIKSVRDIPKEKYSEVLAALA